MEFLKENRNIIIIIAIIAICYLFLQTDVFKKMFTQISMKWNELSTFMKIVVILIVIWITYYLYNRQDY